MDPKALRETRIDPKDHLSRWGVEYFQALPANADRGLAPMLAAAMERKYSGNPGEGFFTGGGLHYFGNFSKLDNAKIMTVQQALQQSTNLVFVRLMRDVARYYMFQLPGSSAALLADADDPRRAEYLARFADAEGKTFLAKFWNKYKGKTGAEAQALLLSGVRPAASKLAAVHRTAGPERDAAGVRRLHRRHPAERSRPGTHRRRCTTSTPRPTCRWPTAAMSPRPTRSNSGWSATCAPIRKPAGPKR